MRFISRLIPRTTRPVLLLLLAFVMLNGIVWSFALKLEGGADERLHLNVAQFIEREHRIPEFGESEEMGILPWETEGRVVAVYSYAGQPGFTYMLAAAAIALPSDSEWMDAHQARTVNIAWMVAFVAFMYLALCQFMPARPRLAIAGATMAGAWPQATWVTSTFNADGMALACSAGTFWALWRGARRGWSVRDASLLGALAGLVLLAKPTGFVILPFVLGGFLVTARGPARRTLRLTAVGVGVVLLVAGWWYINAARMYGIDDPFAYSRGVEIADDLGITHKQAPIADTEVSLREFAFQEGYVDNVMTRFAGYWPVDQITTALPTRHLLWILAIFVIGYFGLLIRCLDALQRSTFRDRMTWLGILTFAAVPTSVAILILHNYYVAFEPRGRYLFPVFVPLVGLAYMGLEHLLRSDFSERVVTCAIALSMIWINVSALRFNVVRWTGLGYDAYDGSWQQLVAWAWGASLLALVAAVAIFLLRRSPNDVTPINPSAAP